MTWYRDHLTDLVDKENNLHVVLGDNARYNVKGVGTSTFQLYSNMQLQLREVLYVPGMKSNLVSISALEDKGYKVTFSEGRVLQWMMAQRLTYKFYQGNWCSRKQLVQINHQTSPGPTTWHYQLEWAMT
jgi:hypothetical protein